jgi:hypothetical protein
MDERQLSRLTSALLEEAAQADGELRVTVTKQTGTVEVRISGRNASRRFVFEGVEEQATHIRQAMSKALESYGPSLVYEVKDDLARPLSAASGGWSTTISVLTGGTLHGGHPIGDQGLQLDGHSLQGVHFP